MTNQEFALELAGRVLGMWNATTAAAEEYAKNGDKKMGAAMVLAAEAMLPLMDFIDDEMPEWSVVVGTRKNADARPEMVLKHRKNGSLLACEAKIIAKEIKNGDGKDSSE